MEEYPHPFIAWLAFQFGWTLQCADRCPWIVGDTYERDCSAPGCLEWKFTPEKTT